MPKAGDFVKVHSSKGIFEGILLPHPDILAQDIVVIKLKNGYNIGLDKKNIKKIQLIKSAQPKKPKSSEKARKNPKLPTIALLSTGGTISSRIDYSTGAVYADYDADDFVAMCPELSQFANIKAKKISSIMSEDMLPEDWVKIAK